jgi:hypothetical protein
VVDLRMNYKSMSGFSSRHFMSWLIGLGTFFLLVFSWLYIFKSAMRKPNNENEFSRDDHPNITPF